VGVAVAGHMVIVSHWDVSAKYDIAVRGLGQKP
jgi:hypothetical protein